MGLSFSLYIVTSMNVYIVTSKNVTVVRLFSCVNFILLALFMCVMKLSNSVSECSKMIKMSSIKRL